MGKELQESLACRNKYRAQATERNQFTMSEFDVVNDRMLAVRDDLMEFLDNTGKRIAVAVAEQHVKLGMKTLSELHAFMDDQRRSIVTLSEETAKLQARLDRRWYKTVYAYLKKVVRRLHDFRIFSSNDASHPQIRK